MNKYSKLIEANVISLSEVLIQNYKQLGLDEINMTILLLLNLQRVNQNDFLSISMLAEKMTLDETEISKRILNLLQMGYLELNIDETGEKFSLDPLYDKVTEIIFEEQKDNVSDSVTVSEIVEYCEKTYQRILSRDDLEIVNMWSAEKYSLEEIKSAVLESLKAQKTTLRYADAIIVNRRNNQNREQIIVDSELQEVLRGINVKRKN